MVHLSSFWFCSNTCACLIKVHWYLQEIRQRHFPSSLTFCVLENEVKVINIWSVLFHLPDTYLHLWKSIHPGLKVIKLFSCSTQLRIKFILLINVKMPTIVDILTFINRINTPSESLKGRKSFVFGYFSFYQQLKFHAQLSWAWKKFYNLGARSYSAVFFNLIRLLGTLRKGQCQWSPKYNQFQ